MSGNVTRIANILHYMKKSFTEVCSRFRIVKEKQAKICDNKLSIGQSALSQASLRLLCSQRRYKRKRSNIHMFNSYMKHIILKVSQRELEIF